MSEVLATKRLALPAPVAEATRPVLAWPLALALPALVSAHFQELIPSSDSLECGNR